MGCVLSVIGAELNVDEFVQNTGLAGFKKKYKGDWISKRRNSKLNYSWASLSITDDNYEDINIQIKEAESFLIIHKKQLTFIAINEDIEYATIDFGVTSTTQSQNKSQSFYFPISLLTICAELKIGIELSTYSF